MGKTLTSQLQAKQSLQVKGKKADESAAERGNSISTPKKFLSSLAEGKYTGSYRPEDKIAAANWELV